MSSPCILLLIPLILLRTNPTNIPPILLPISIPHSTISYLFSPSRKKNKKTKMRKFFNIHAPLTPETEPEQHAISEHLLFHNFKAHTTDPRFPGSPHHPLPLTRRLTFQHHLPIFAGIYVCVSGTTVEQIDSIQDMLMQMGFTIRGMWRRHLRGQSVDDGKVGYLDGVFQAWVAYLEVLWKAMTADGMVEESKDWFAEAAEMVQLTEEVVAFVRDMDIAGVGFLSWEWDRAAREWTEAMMSVEGWLCKGQDWRGRFCALMQGRLSL